MDNRLAATKATPASNRAAGFKPLSILSRVIGNSSSSTPSSVSPLETTFPSTSQPTSVGTVVVSLPSAPRVPTTSNTNTNISGNNSASGMSGDSSASSTLQSGQKKRWKYQLLDLEEVLENSPMSRERMRTIHSDVDDFGNRLKKILKTSRQIAAVTHDLGLLHRQFASEMIEFSELINDEEIGNGVVKLANVTKEIENFQEVLIAQMENLITIPIQNFVKHGLDDIKERRKKFEKMSSRYDSALAKASQIKKNTTNALKDMEIEHDLNDAKQDFRVACLDLAFSLNDIQARKTFEFLENTTAFSYSNLGFYHQAYELYNELSPLLRSLTTYIQKSKAEHEEERKEALEHKKTLELLDTSVPSKQYPLNSSSISSSSSSSSSASTTVSSGFSSSPSISPNNISSAKTIQGYLFKRNTNMRNNWTRRYFVIQDGTLQYYKHGKDLNAVNVINLLLCSVKTRDDIDRRFCFEIISPDKSFLLQAENEEKKQEWISVLQNATADLINNQDLSKKSAYGTIDDNSKSKVIEDQNGILQTLRGINECNSLCADCGAKDPDWASTNLGVLICIKCSGIHRSMGVHISKVRSFTLDKWDPELVKLMSAIGNENVNRIFESKIPPEIKKPEPDADSIDREKWIRLKYQAKEFVDKTFYANQSQKELNELLYEASMANTPLDILKCLALGANINYASEKDGLKTCGHRAVIEGKLLNLVLLLQNRIDVNCLDAQHWTPLHHAAFLGRVDAAYILFKNGAKLDIRDGSNLSPLDVAIAHQKADLVTFLRLAQMAIAEGQVNSTDDSFSEALQHFSIDAQSLHISQSAGQ